MGKLELLKKKKYTATNSIELGDTINDERYGKGRKFTSRFMEAGIMYYEESGDVLITKEVVDTFIKTMIGCPVIIDHTDIYDDNADKERVGVVSDVWFNSSDAWFYCSGVIWDKQALDLIENYGFSVSCCYRAYEEEPKYDHYHAMPYDAEVTDGEFLHLALVDKKMRN